MIDNLITGRQAKAPRILLYGSEGVGKSTFAAGANKPLFIQTEDGLNQIDCTRFPLAEDYDTFNRYLDQAVYQDHDYKTIIIDSVDWLEKIIHQKLCNDSGVATIELACGGFGKGYTQTKVLFESVLKKLEAARQRGITVILIAHAKVDKFIDPECGQIDRFDSKLHDKTNSVIKEWADVILFATRLFGANKGDTAKNERIVRTAGGPAYVAKNRYNLPEVMPLDYNVVFGEIIKSMKQ